jgi:hypothetical protein
MAPFSAGLALEFPPSPPQFVYLPSFPFRKNLWVYQAIWFSSLEFDVFTSYDTWTTTLAEVQINGVLVGRIEPRGWAQGVGVLLSPISFQFGNGMLNKDALGIHRTGMNVLEIIPKASYDWLIVGNWRMHYQQDLAP